MNQESLSFTLTQISYLVTNLNKKNFPLNSQLISKLVKQFGLEADRHLLRCLFSSIDFADATQVSKNSLQAKLLSLELTTLLNKSSLISNICFAVDNCLAHQKSLKPTQNLINQISKSLNCSPIQEVTLSVALIHSSNPDLSKYAEQHLKICLPNLIQSYIELDSRPNQEGGLNDISPELLQLILSLLSHGKHLNISLSDNLYKKFINQLCRDFPRDRVPLILAPLLYKEDIEISIETLSSNSQGILTSAIMDTTWANLVMDIGYTFTNSIEDCKNHLVKSGGREITAQDVAKILGLMCRTHTNLSDSSINLSAPASFWTGSQTNEQSNKEKLGSSSSSTIENATWKPEVFVQSLKEIVPNLSWKEVCIALDHPDFSIKDRAGLNLLVTTVRIGMQTSNAGQTFPAECLYRHWTNAEGQLSLITVILKNPDIYSFADHIYTSVSVELLKTPPENDNKEIATWKSLHLVEVLLYIAENNLYTAVKEIFKVPVQHYPDVLFMALLQINPPVTVLRQELFSKLVSHFLGNHPNSGAILHHAWNAANFNHLLKHIIMQAMSDWYIHGENDQSRLSRILDVAQDLKALSGLLNARSFMFVIDLACLASRREYLKLEKWLADKIREHGEPFVQAIVKFLHRRCPMLAGAKTDDATPKASQLPHETLNIILSCLQNCIGNVQQELSDIIITMTTQSNMMLNKSRQQQQQQQQQPPPPGVLRSTHRGLETPYSAASLGGQVFTDSLSGLNSSMGALNLGAPGSSSFNFGNVLGNIISTPASPSRLLPGSSNSPFPLMSMPASTVSNLGRVTQPSALDKLNLTNTPPVFPDIAQQVPKEVEDEANSYFQRIYNHPPHPTLSIDEVLDMLQRFQESPTQREREVYQCMLRNLFEEYKFFPQYPDKELQITAQLFGGMIERNLVQTYVALGLALRCVLDALRKPDGTKMYYFGITALDRFKNKLHLYHKYSEHVRSLPHFNEFPPTLIEYVEYGAQGLEPPNKVKSATTVPTTPPTQAQSTTVAPSLYRSSSVTGNIVTTPGAVKSSASSSQGTIVQPSRVQSIANATNIDTLLCATAERITSPPDAIQDKTAFIFNNLSQLNLQQKCEEIKDIMSKEYWPWISQYLVMKRASIEINFHVLYSNFLDALKIPDITKLVTKETFRNIRVLLRSDKGIANFSDRSLLKNLGHWLGMLTLGRNRPILLLDLDMKSLLFEAYSKGQQELLYVVPFVAKVLESCAKSKVFKPPNPWTMAIMNVLAELHQEADLKLNLKFEIEVLCKNLSIDVANLKPAIYLKDPERIQKIEFQLSQRKDTPPSLQLEEVVVQPAITGPNAGAITAPSPSNPVLDVANIPSTAPEPRFNYMEINVSSFANINQHITYSPNVALFHTHAHLKGVVIKALERTISEWLSLVVDRSVKIATKTCEPIIRKDFALDPDDVKMRQCSHSLVRYLTAGMAMITCRDQLMQSIQNNMKSAFMTSLTVQHKDLVDAAAQQLAVDNMELVCAFIQKTAIEKAAPEVDKVMLNDFEIRKLARQEGRRYYDQNVLTYQNERMPEQIRLKIGGITQSQLAVYEEYARNIPGFLPISERDSALFMPKTNKDVIPVPTPAISQFPSSGGVSQPQASFGADEIGSLYDELASKMDVFLNGAVGITVLQVQSTNMHALLESLIVARRTRDNHNACNLLSKAVEGLLEGYQNIPDHPEQIKLYREIHLRVLRLLQDGRAFGPTWTNKAIARCMLECREEIRYNMEAVNLLISNGFVNLVQYDGLLTQLMDQGNNYLAVSFAMQLIQTYFIDERSNPLSENDFINTIELLARLSAHPRAPEGLPHLIEMLRSNHDPNTFLVDRAISGPTSFIHSGILQARTDDVDAELTTSAEYLLKEWNTIYHAPTGGRDIKTFSIFVSKMNLIGIFKGDESLTKFFRLSTQLCIDLTYRHLNDPNLAPTVAKAKIFYWIDAFVHLITMLVKHSGDNANSSTKINLLNKVLGIVVGILLQDQEIHGNSFQQLGYHRIFIMLFLELSTNDAVLENISLNVITAFCHTLHILQPSAAPGFCYSWLELISHRVFIGRTLAILPQQKGWSMYSQLLIDLFKYLAPFLRNAELAKPVQFLYKGTLRVLLVLLHDFPEFLCDYHFGFCDVIPPNCIQMRNLILSAYPRNMRLPDPFTPNLKVDMLTDISATPRIFTNYSSAIQPANFKKDLDSYLKARAPVTFLSELRGNLQISNEPGSRYNIPLMNALVLYVGTQAIAHIRSKNLNPNMTTIVHSAHMDIFQNLAVDLDNEGRYLFLNAIANQLRYPNSHTHYFSCALLYLFVEANSEAIQEQITRVLLERLIVNRPHPWGLLITFIELIKNPAYKFWDHDFVHCAPEIEKLFESVARSCMVLKNNPAQITSVENELQECN